LSTCQYKYEYGFLPKKFACKEPCITNSKFCFFHDGDHYAEHKAEAIKRFEEIVANSISKNEPLECFECYLPDIDLRGKNFAQPVYFVKATFYGRVDFSYATFSKGANFLKATFSEEEANFYGATFSEEANFYGATFSKGASFSYATFSKGANFWNVSFSQGQADFSYATFSKGANFLKATFSKGASFYKTTFSEGEANFWYATFFKGEANFFRAKFLAEASFVNTQFGEKLFFSETLFEKQNRVIFDNSDLSNVSFADTDITRLRFGDNITGGGDDGFTIIEERWLANKVKGQTETEYANISLELVLSAYRNLRENYEFRLRYDDAGKFFIKEEELKRKYREIRSQKGSEIKENSWFRQHLSLTGLYYHLSRYGESISRPALIGAITIFLSTLFWVTQSNPTLEPHFDPSLVETATTSTFVGFREVGNASQWLKGFERSLAGFVPLLSLGGDIKIGMIDYIIKIFGGGLTFVLLAIALRRKFERKYTR
jgi:uncharacterized protein YjbI with pentapeptide repeats